MRKIILSLAAAVLIVGTMGATAGSADAGPRRYHGGWKYRVQPAFHMRMRGGRNAWRRERFRPQICGWRVDYRHNRGTVWRCSPALMTR